MKTGATGATGGLGAVRTQVRAEVINVAIVVAILAVLCLAIPIATSGVAAHPFNQYLIGSAVNATLVFAGLRFRRAVNVFAVVLVPSLCVIALGALGINAIFMMYLVPFLWLGNMAIVFAFRTLAKQGVWGRYAPKSASARFALASAIGIALKVSIIFGGFLTLRALGAFPAPVASQLFIMMGMVQILTATLGCAIAFAAVKLARY